MNKLKILLASPRGFCAGVDRAITIVEKALEKYGKPVYVRHEIVHNKFVVDDLKNKGAIFVKELDEIPDGFPVIFSAHGVPKKVTSKAIANKMIYLDATCPLVSRVHRSIEKNYKSNATTILIGHNGHPEVIGSIGQLPKGSIILVEDENDVDNLSSDLKNKKLMWSTQTTLSIDETKNIITRLKQRFPNIEGPEEGDICYATTNRQNAVKAIAMQSDFIYVIGSQNSSNSKRLVDASIDIGCNSKLINSPDEIDFEMLNKFSTIGITAGASAPEILVKQVIKRISQKFEISLEEIETTKENVSFPLPRNLI